MTYKPGQNNKNESDRREILEQFPADERDHIRKIWDMSVRAVSKQPEITKDEVEGVLSVVHRRIGTNDKSSDSETRLSNSSYKWKWILAAAVILLVFGAGILMIPKTVTAPYGEVTAVTLPDGSTVELNSGSQLRFNRLFNFTHRKVHLDGEAFFAVRDGDHSFLVNANNSTVQVTGTKFNIRSWNEGPGKETEVTVSEGTVLFYPYNDTERSVTIIPGQWSRWTIKMEEPSEPEPVKLEQVLGWRENKLIFNEKSLAVIFSELERRFDVNIQLESGAIGQESLTTYYAKPESVESVIRDICRVKGLRYTETANGFRVYR